MAHGAVIGFCDPSAWQNGGLMPFAKLCFCFKAAMVAAVLLRLSITGFGMISMGYLRFASVSACAGFALTAFAITGLPKAVNAQAIETAALSGSLLDDVPDSVFNPETFTLDNGMEVVVITNDRAPVVTHMVWYKVGAADDPRGKSGLAHYLEHLMFKSTDNLESGEFSRIIASVGGRENAFTSYEYTGYFQTVARGHW